MHHTTIREAPILALLCLTSCDLVGFGAVTIRPTYGWEDGCTAVKISGHGFGSDATATIGGAPVTGIAFPDPAEFPLDEGFYFYAVTPAGTVGAQDVVVTSGGGTDTIPDAFTYITCPMAPYVEAMDPSDGVTAGATIALYGCSIDAKGMQVEVRDPAGVLPTAIATLTPACGTAQASFPAPDMTAAAKGLTFEVYVTDGQGNDLFPPPCVDKDTSDTADPCLPPLYLTYAGGAR